MAFIPPKMFGAVILMETKSCMTFQGSWPTLPRMIGCRSAHNVAGRGYTVIAQGFTLLFRDADSEWRARRGLGPLWPDYGSRFQSNVNIKQLGCRRRDCDFAMCAGKSASEFIRPMR